MYGQGNKAAMPKSVAKEQKGEKKAPSMPKKEGAAGMKYSGGTHNGGSCYTHGRKSSQ
jgi:hypothetical protein